MMDSKTPRPLGADLWARPEVKEAIESVLRRRGVRASDVEDLRQVVLEKGLRVQPPPSTQQGCLALARKIAGDLATDYFRSRASRGKSDVGPCDDADGRPAPSLGHGDSPHPIDARRQLEHVQKQIAEGLITARQADILEQAADGVPQPEIAKALGLAHQTVRNDLSAARSAMRRSWALFATAAMFVAFGIFLVFRRDEVVIVGHGRPPGPESSGSVAPTEAARELRTRALQDYEQGRWADALAGLDRAAAIDPVGDKAAPLQAVRRDCEKRLREHGLPRRSDPERGAPSPDAKP
ncbi:MAG TPA: hypothetical protein VGY54_17235 [Polyangiaceae bacterium]|jgi:DNA-directed RNA polymerase specialized sigma24 family protein|nr:hypothetical protein [Polyangiaceae bacterium]